ncbi:Pseudoazurin precursor [Rubellimicrobium mesophilum DSM 19309]|uniref:Pseudoazurin n=1 Tax=Rubellimicrobium mesophilum DSM 19309 TaxID=442562 RepID=A0A017HSV2_9RHOB|nr:pseudoazurin [Rubellimicrobium mesophilum]EYD77243.1 Pseudoazurin precursor [Rubellimicrobium mesophilum DSM 19309]
MRIQSVALATALALVGGSAMAATIEVQMLNKGEQGVMVFEPAFVQAQPGDTIHFVPTNPGHNAESIEGMLPEGAEPFVGEAGQEISVTLTEEGLYGVECKPHAGMGMVALIQVGQPTNQEAFAAAVDAMRGKAKERMTADLGLVTEDVASAQ